MIQRWNHRPFTVGVEVYLFEGVLCATDDDQPVGVGIPLPAGCDAETPLEIVLDCTSSGYYDPGRLSGPPEHCYPPEGEDDREIVSAELKHPAGTVDIDAAKLVELRERFASQIEGVEIGTDDDCDYFNDE